jgi:hypothetical protein
MPSFITTTRRQHYQLAKFKAINHCLFQQTYETDVSFVSAKIPLHNITNSITYMTTLTKE